MVIITIILAIRGRNWVSNFQTRPPQIAGEISMSYFGCATSGVIPTIRLGFLRIPVTLRCHLEVVNRPGE